jgi:UDP-N-acetylmuramoyl-tripeptide--D-alanyl-D-alanine ligase
MFENLFASILWSNYTIFAILFVIIGFYKFLFWSYVIQLKEYRIDRFREYLGTPQWKSALCNFWFILEFVVLVFTTTIIFDPQFEIVVYSMFFYFLVFELIFVIWKLARKNILIPKITSRFLITSLVFMFIFASLLTIILTTTIPILAYAIILVSFFSMPFLIFCSILITLPLVNYQKKKKIQSASKKSESIHHPIKIWITGSYGKSSVKQYLWQILASQSNVLTTPDNINTELWVSSIVENKLTDDYDYFVAEMWAYKIWEIDILWKIVGHKYWFLTAIWNQHLALFWWIENTKIWKFQIANSSIENWGKVYVNYDNKYIRDYIEDYSWDSSLFIKYGINNSEVDIKWQIHNIVDGFVEFSIYKDDEKYDFKTNLLWSHNILNLTGTLGFCIDMWLDLDKIKKELLQLEVPKSTLEITKIWETIMIDDTYNLSEDWLYAWLDVANSYWDDTKITLVVDDILELWKLSEKKHEQIAENIVKNYRVDSIFHVGKNYKKNFEKWLENVWYTWEIISWVEINSATKQVFLFEGRGAMKIFKKSLADA